MKVLGVWIHETHGETLKPLEPQVSFWGFSYFRITSFQNGGLCFAMESKLCGLGFILFGVKVIETSQEIFKIKIFFYENEIREEIYFMV